MVIKVLIELPEFIQMTTDVFQWVMSYTSQMKRAFGIRAILSNFEIWP